MMRLNELRAVRPRHIKTDTQGLQTRSAFRWYIPLHLGIPQECRSSIPSMLVQYATAFTKVLRDSL